MLRTLREKRRSLAPAAIAAVLIGWWLFSYGSCVDAHHAVIGACLARGPASASRRLLIFVERHTEPISTITTAVATIFIAWFTRTLQLSTAKLWEVSRDQVELSRRALEDFERPYVFIYGLEMSRGIVHGKTGDVPALLNYAISNNGKLAAKVEQVKIGCGMEDDHGRFPPLVIQGDHELVRSPMLSDHDKLSNTYLLYPSDPIAGRAVEPVPPTLMSSKLKNGAIFQVVVSYRGPSTRGHETAQCWRYRQGLGFVEVEDSKYTYTR